jgi:nucleotide-binding universal stress UspA family protein
VDLGDAPVERVLASGGQVEVVDAHEGLGRSVASRPASVARRETARPGAGTAYANTAVPREDPMTAIRRIRRIVHATDFSPASRPAFVRAVDLARANRAELVVLHVMTPPVLYTADGYALPDTYDRLLTDARSAAKSQLDRVVAQAKGAGVRARGLLLEGVAPERIVRGARSARADLLVIGTHGRTGLARLFLGSVASRVIATASCPVLSVRAGTGRADRARGRSRARPGRRRSAGRPGRA